MQVKLGIKNIVLAGVINPNLFDKYFFIKTGIVKNEEDILPVSMFNPGVTQLVTDSFSVMVSSSQIVVSPRNTSIDEDDIQGIAIKIANNGDISGITGLGINFHWLLSDGEKSLHQMTRENFYNEKVEIFNRYFDTPDSMFGAYVSSDFKGSRLKLDVKPQTVTDTKTGIKSDHIGFQFNFHIEAPGINIIQFLEDYREYQNKSKEIMGTYTK